MDFADRVPDLLRPTAFGHAARDVCLIETHISWVLLAGEFAYKLRKPVDFGFLDFSTRAQRQEDCLAEVRLNRRLCPDLYLGVVDVVERADGLLYVGGTGRAVEPAVQMRRLPDRGMLPCLLQREEADARLMQRIARCLAEFHLDAPTGAGVDDYGTLASIRANWEENFRQVPPALVEPHKLDRIRAYAQRFMAEHAELFARRVQTGRIRDGHGDLHAGSVCVWGRTLYLFDCIEFNARFRCADVAAEVAFLAMDLEHCGQAELAAAFVDAYVRSTADAELGVLLDFYKCYRAFVRGKVLAFRLGDPSVDDGVLERIRCESRAYFDLAYAYACPFERPMLIVTMGLPASGKSTLARGLAGRLGLPYLSSDVVRKRLLGVRPTVHRSDPFQRGIYTRGMTRRTYGALRRKASRWLRQGRSVVLDATYGLPAERAAVRQVARRARAQTYFILCHADESVLEARLASRLHDAASTSDARPEIWPALRAAFVAPDEVAVAFDADTTRPVETLLDQICADIYQTQAHPRHHTPWSTVRRMSTAGVSKVHMQPHAPLFTRRIPSATRAAARLTHTFGDGGGRTHDRSDPDSGGTGGADGAGHPCDRARIG